MAIILTDQELINAKRDIDDIGKAVNKKEVVHPRYGDSFKSLPMIIDEFQISSDAAEAAAVSAVESAGIAQSSSQIAQDSAALAELAATAATIGGKVYSAPESGVDPVTGVADGDYFNVRSSSDESYVDEYQNIGGVATPTGKSYLSALGVQQQEKPASTIKDANGKDQQQINDGLATYLTIEQFSFVAGEADDTSRINRLIQKAAAMGVRDVYITDGDYSINPAVTSNDWLGLTNGGGVQLLSGVHVWLSKNARLVSKASSFNGYNVVAAIAKKDCGIYGGKVIGDRTIHIGTTGEHGMGVNVRGSEDVYIFTDVEDCWGDGIYIGSAYAANGIPCKNVHVKSVCYNNRRQGMSVVDVDGLFVYKGTQFNKTNGVAPQSGFDLEPNANQTVQNVYMEHVVCRENTAVGALIYAEASNANVKNVTIDYLETTDNPGFGLRVHGAGTNGVHIKKLVTARNANVAAIMHNNVKNITIDHHSSTDDYRPIQAANSSGITIGYHESVGATFSFPLFTNIQELVIKNIEPKNTNFANAIQINNCPGAKVAGKTIGSSSNSVIIDGCNDGEFVFEVSGNMTGDYIQVKGASTGNTITLKAGESQRTSNGGYGVHLTDTANNNDVVHCVMKSQANTFKSAAGVFCGVNTANNRVRFNDVSEGFYYDRSVVDASGNNILEYNSGQFIPRTPIVVNNDMSNKASVYNKKNKFVNRQVYSATNGRLYFATGTSDVSAWRPVGAVDASTDIVPV